MSIIGRELAAGPPPRVTVIVPHYDDLPRLDLCLADLQRQTLTPSEIIVADNNSPQGVAAVEAAIAGRARLIVVKQKGAGPARNGGANAASGDILAFTDCDCRPAPEWLDSGVRALAKADLVGGRMTVLVDDPARMTPTEAFEAIFAFDNESYIKKKNFTVTANLFCRRETFARVGGFEVGVSEDVEWCRRAIAMGCRLAYEPAAVVGHPARRTWNELRRKWDRTSHEEYLLRATSRKGLLIYAVRALLLPASVIVHAPIVLITRRIHGAKNRAGALHVLARLRLWRLWKSMRLVLS